MKFQDIQNKTNGFLYNKTKEIASSVPIDTHIENQIPSWKTRIMELKNRDFNLDKEYEAQSVYDTNEIGFSHPEQDSFLKFYDNGDIRMMSGEASGLSVNNKFKTVNIYGHSINTRSKVLNINTLDGGLIINGYALNPQMYLFCNQNYNDLQLCDLRLDATVKYWEPAKDEDDVGYWADKHISISPFLKIQEDSEMASLIENLMNESEENINAIE